MAITRTKNDTKPYSLTHIWNMGFDPEFQVPVVELMAWDATNNSIKRVTTGQLSGFSTNNIDEASATLTYIGKEDGDGAWYVQKIDTSSGTAITYATLNNNAAVTDYTTAWTNRGTLTYNNYSTAF
jgi:hypothetical protein